MCGIGGILFAKNHEEGLRKRIKKIEHAQLHRGPDEQNIWVKNNAVLCHQRLSIIDPKNGQQPMKDNSGRYIISYNGELYNYKELYKELSGSYHFMTHSDTEVLLAAYIKWGKLCLNHFIGMFSFLIWDTKTETAFAARDVLGVKPFVYSLVQNEFIFASEVKAIIPVLPSSPQINEYAISETVLCPSLSGVTHSPFKEIHLLQAGSYLEISKSGIKTTIYHNWNISPKNTPDNLAIEQFKEEFAKSVQYSLNADVDVGCFLSGGLDSSYIAAQAKNLTNTNLKTYGILFDHHNKIKFSEKTIVVSNDKPFTEFMVSKYQLEHQWAIAKQDHILNSLEELAITNDRICTWEQELAQHFLSKKAARDVKTVLVGDAADETNYGYFFLLNQTVSSSAMGIANLFGASNRSSLLNPHLSKQKNFTEYLHSKYTQTAKNSGFNFGANKQENMLATSALVYKLWLGRLLHNGDIHTMKNSLEARVPFANQNLLEVVKNISPELGFRNNTEKFIVRNAAQNTLHEKIRLRKKSALPRDPRLGHKFQATLHNLLKGDNPFIDKYLNRRELVRISELKSPVSEIQRMTIFNIVTLIYWSKHYVK